MIYACAKCEFVFERKNEPSKCPSCENQYVVGANSKQRQAFQLQYGNKMNFVETGNTDTSSKDTQ